MYPALKPHDEPASWPPAPVLHQLLMPSEKWLALNLPAHADGSHPYTTYALPYHASPLDPNYKHSNSYRAWIPVPFLPVPRWRHQPRERSHAYTNDWCNNVPSDYQHNRWPHPYVGLKRGQHHKPHRHR